MTSLSNALSGPLAKCVVVLLCATACGPKQKPAESAADVVRSFARALGDEQAEAAYALMAPEYRARVSYETWRRNFDANPQEVREAEQRLSQARRDESRSDVMRQADGQVIALREHDGYWYMASEQIEFYDQSSPRATLRSFVEALARRRYDVVLRLTPEADKEGATSEDMEKSFGYAARDEVERLLSQLRAHVDAPIESTGDEATMPYADHKRVQFVREEGRWRIVEPE